MTDYTGHAMYQQAMRTYDDPEFAAWLCETYPWGAVDMGRARSEYLSLSQSGHVVSDLDRMDDHQAITYLEHEYPCWTVYRGRDDLCHARHHGNDVHLRGEDWVDLRDMLNGWIGRNEAQ